MRAAQQIHNLSFLQSTAEIIDRETGVREPADILENIITEAGDLIESRSRSLPPKPVPLSGVIRMKLYARPNDARHRHPPKSAAYFPTEDRASASFTNLSRESTAANGPMGIFSLSTPKQSVMPETAD